MRADSISPHSAQRSLGPQPRDEKQFTAECAENAEERLRRQEMTMELNKITEIVIGAAIAVHRALGPGLLESTYEACMLYELNERGLKTERQKALPVAYRGCILSADTGLTFWLKTR